MNIFRAIQDVFKMPLMQLGYFCTTPRKGILRLNKYTIQKIKYQEPSQIPK